MSESSADLPFEISRRFNASRDKVWKAWAQRDELMKWFGPKGFTMAAADLDFRLGGSFHYCLKAPDGKEMWGKFIYREIVAPERIVFASMFSDKDRGVTRHPFATDWPREMLTTTTFTEVSGKTTIHLSWKPLNATEVERVAFDKGRPGMTQGWTGTFEQLEAYLARA